MSEENVEVVRRALVFFVGLGPVEPDRAADVMSDFVLQEFLDPEIEFLPLAQGGLSRNTYTGYEGVRRFWGDLFSDWDEFHAEPKEIVDAGSQVAVVMHMKGRMHELEIDALWSHLWTVRDGRVLRLESFASPEGAVEAAELSK